jgi:hypothetical protein
MKPYSVIFFTLVPVLLVGFCLQIYGAVLYTPQSRERFRKRVGKIGTRKVRVVLISLALLIDLLVLQVSRCPVVSAWQTIINGTANSNDAAQAIAIDHAGDIIAGGVLINNVADFAVVKLSGGNGSHIWKRSLGNGTVLRLMVRY